MKRKRLLQMFGLALCLLVHFFFSGQIPTGWNLITKAAAQVQSFTITARQQSAGHHPSTCITTCNKQP